MSPLALLFSFFLKVLIIGADNGPDEASKSLGVKEGIAWLQKRWHFDAIYYRNSAPKNSAFNRVERTMAPLSRLIVGKTLPHDHYGTHLNGGEVNDEELCLKNLYYG